MKMPEAPRRLLPLLILIAGCGSAADLLRCPQQVAVQQRLPAPVAGWSAAMDDGPNRLSGVTFFDGKPEERASLAPDSESKANGRIISTWRFDSGRPVWVACRYAATSVTLTRELPKSVRQCSITYDARQSLAGLPVMEKVDCK